MCIKTIWVKAYVFRLKLNIQIMFLVRLVSLKWTKSFVQILNMNFLLKLVNNYRKIIVFHW